MRSYLVHWTPDGLEDRVESVDAEFYHITSTGRLHFRDLAPGSSLGYLDKGVFETGIWKYFVLVDTEGPQDSRVVTPRDS